MFGKFIMHQKTMPYILEDINSITVIYLTVFIHKLRTSEILTKIIILKEFHISFYFHPEDSIEHLRSCDLFNMSIYQRNRKSHTSVYLMTFHSVIRFLLMGFCCSQNLCSGNRQVVPQLRAYCKLILSLFKLLSHVSSLRLPSGHSGPVLPLNSATRSSPFSPHLLVADVSIWATFLLEVAFRQLWVLFIFPPS